MVLKELTKLSRGPFQRQLAKLLGCAPSAEAIRGFAEKHPDRWAQAVAIFAPLAGIQRDAPVQVNILNVGDMSDAQLFAHAQRLGVPLEPVDVAKRQQLDTSADSLEHAVSTEAEKPNLAELSPEGDKLELVPEGYAATPHPYTKIANDIRVSSTTGGRSDG